MTLFPSYPVFFIPQGKGPRKTGKARAFGLGYPGRARIFPFFNFLQQPIGCAGTRAVLPNLPVSKINMNDVVHFLFSFLSFLRWRQSSEEGTRKHGNLTRKNGAKANV